MRALHNARNNRPATTGSRTTKRGCRFVSMLLCLCMIASMMTNFSWLALSPTAQATDYVTGRKADPNTMDDYLTQLLSTEWGSRYAGRIWTDKSVFAYAAGGGNSIPLDMKTDGYNGSVGFNADFAHVFSALASSQVINEWPPAPIDLVIAIDMSASMAQDTRYAINGLNDETNNNNYLNFIPAENRTMADRIKNSRIQKTLDAVNETIDALMEQNKENRVSVVVYGAGATVLMPLSHYAKVDGTQPYLTVGGMETLYRQDDLTVDDTHGWVWTRNIDACYTIVANAMKDDDDGPSFAENYKKTVSNNVDNSSSNPKSANGYDDGQTYTEKVTANPGYEKWDGIDPKNAKFNEAKKELDADTYVGYYTNTQGGIFLAYAQLAQTEQTTFTGTLTTGQEITVARIPAAIIMTDGGANFAFNQMDDWSNRYGDFDHQYYNEWNQDLPYYRNDNASTNGSDATDFSHRLGDENQKGDEWYNVYLPGVDDTNKITSLYNKGAIVDKDDTILGVNTLTTAPAWNHAGIFYSSDGDPFGTSGTVLETLLTAAYMRYVTETHYTNGWESNGATKESRSDLLTYTMSVDSENVPQWGRMRLYPSLDPEKYSLDSDDAWWSDETIFGSEDIGQGAESIYNKSAVYTGLKNSWQSWKNGISRTQAQFVGTQRGYIDTLPDGGYNDPRFGSITVTNADVIDNIVYTDGFYDVESGNMGERFKLILSEITGNVFTPISGSNDAGVGDSITYQDPLGEYMEIKNEAIQATPHHVDGGATGEGTEHTYDMSLLLFGEMHGLVRAGVYDWNWNDTWMSLNQEELQGEAAFPMGWYKGEPAKGQTKLDNDHIKQDSDGSSTYPASDYPYSDKTYNSAQEARDDGWVFRFNFETMLQFVPLVSTLDPKTHPSDLPEQVKNTVYTCYRFAGSQEDRNELKRNPIFGEVPTELLTQWNEYYAKEHSYPATNDIYSGTRGVYRLSDIRVWVEDTGDFTDTDGAIAPNQGYDRSLYLNIPAAAVPTQLATVTLGQDGVLSYLTNLATDKGIDYDKVKDATEETNPDDFALKQQYEAYSAQSTPLRLFYAVGLEENLILRDSDGKQIGVDFSKISPEYITAHQVYNSDTGEQQNYVWFISNYYSNTSYTEYVTDTATSRTRGDPTVTFSPSVDNRYYVFQKPLPLYAHAYRNTADGLKAVDRNDGEFWNDSDNKNGGNGKMTWETVEGTDAPQTPGSWVGGEYMGTYADVAAFNAAKETAEHSSADDKGNKYITDSKGTKYLYQDDGIVFLEQDLLDHVTSNSDEAGGGYADGSVSFNSDDYFFILVEYYLPDEDTVGLDDKGAEVPDSFGGRMVQRAVARRGSEFGSGFASSDINNGDMLCWTDMSGKITLQFDYLSKSDTGDLTRGEPTFEKLTYNETELRNYLETTCKIKADATMANPDYDPDLPEDTTTNPKTVNVLDYQVKYWLKVQADEKVQAALEAAKAAALEKYPAGELTAENFSEFMQFAVSARPGGIRSGDMSNNRHTKSENVTNTAYNYYVPTVSDNSETDDGVILNTYLGNNGYLEIANQSLHVTKMLEAPEGFELTDEAKNEEFNYQIYIQGVSGERSAVLTEYNEYGKVWERKLAYIDVLTDNSDLLLTNDSNRALFVFSEINAGPMGTVPSAKQVIQYGTDDDGNPVYYEANEDGTLTFVKDAAGNDTDAVDEDVNPKVTVNGDNPLYYLYLPPINTGTAGEGTTTHVRRLYQNKDYDGTADGYAGTYKDDKDNYDNWFKPNGTTTFVNPGDHAITGTNPGETNRDSYREATAARPAGSRTYWAQDAELIPVSEVTEYEAAAADGALEGPSTFALTSAPSTVWWTHEHESGTYDENGDCTKGTHKNLTYYNLVIRKPMDESSETVFESPFKTRSAYMTTTLKFGVNANNDGGTSAAGSPLLSGDLYDQIIPSADRPDLFGDKDGNLKLANGTVIKVDNAYIAQHTAEFTLKHGEGLLIQGLDNRITYRFTEKLTEDQMAKGFSLKRISHIQQRGSDSIYIPGVQDIPIYTKTDATYGANYGTASGYKTENGLTWKQNGLEPSMEPFAHTNAIMWEYYATMAAGASGNHHQPADVTDEVESSMQIWDQSNANTYTTVEEKHTVSDNPSCVSVDSVGSLAPGKCDIVQGDGTTLHYMYYKGQLIDPHYDGEASTYLRNMARYGVSPTVRFGIEDEDATQPTDTATLPTEDYYNYSGVYSVYGNTGWFEEQANYVNTVDPELLVITKEMVDKNGAVVDPAPDEEFEFTLTLTPSAEAAIEGGKLYYWRGDRDMLTGGKEYGMPDAAPHLYEYDEYLDGDLMLRELTPESDGTYKITLKGHEAVVIYGIPIKTGYSVAETVKGDYPCVGENKKVDAVGAEGYDDDPTKSGTVEHDSNETVAMKPTTTSNREDYYNLMPPGTLIVKKKIVDDDAETVNREFEFTVTLTPRTGGTLDKSALTAVKYDKDGEEETGFKLEWEDVKDASGNVTGLTATFTLRHRESVKIDGMPIGTTYNVAETGRPGYNLQHVADNDKDDPDGDGKYVTQEEDGSVSGEITSTDTDIYLLFANGKAARVPFTGSDGLGADAYLIGGMLLIGLALVPMLYSLGKRRSYRR